MPHTPGPWIAVADGCHSALWDGQPGRQVRVCGPGFSPGMVGDAAQDCRLIAAAPELLESLEAMTNMFEGLARITMRQHYTPSSEERTARVLLARVQGAQP